VKILSVILLTFISFFIAHSQDSIKLESVLSLDIKGQHNLSALATNFDCYNCARDRALDNPLYHFAIYSGVSHKLKINDKYTIETGLFAEERSHSGGNNTLSNLIFYPKILLHVNDTITLADQKIGIRLKGGDFWDQDVGDILRFHNIDYHALQGVFLYREWSLHLFTIGDLSYNVGLDLEQIYRTSIGYEKRNFKTLLHATYNSLFIGDSRSHVTVGDYNFSNYTKYKYNDRFSLEGQVSVRTNSVLNNSIGGVLKGSYKTPSLIFSAAARFYQRNFNQGYNGQVPRYTNGRNYIGAQLYPLKNYYRPFSQWAAYTHLREGDLVALELVMQWERNIFNKLFYFHDLDLNLIANISEDDLIVFPFYNVGVEYKFVNQFKGRISLTNKQMELFTFYQTFAATKIPLISLGVQIGFDNLKLTDKKMKL